MSDDFIIEEEEGSSPFLLIAAALAGIFILAILCIGGYLLLNSGTNGDEGPAFQTRVAENATIAANNAIIQATSDAIATEAARPTDTPAPTDTPTLTPTATNTPPPTETPVVQPVEETPGSAAATSTAIFGDPVNIIGTPTPIGIVAGGSGSGTLPNTGIGAWGALALGLLFLGMLFGVRRLRMG